MASTDPVRVADIPTIHQIDANSYMIVEKPGYEDGTFKATVGDLQQAITVHATVSQQNDVTTIRIQDINGATQETIVTPTATVRDNGNNTITITITDTNGTTQQTIVQNTATFDPVPTEGSTNLVSSGTVYTAIQALASRITQLENALNGLSFSLIV